MYAQSASSALREHGEVAAGLRGFHGAKSILLPGHRQIHSIVAGNLQKDAAVGATLVSLPRRVQEARTESKNSGNFFLIADGKTDALQRFLICFIHSDVTEYGEVIAGGQPPEVRFQHVG